MNSDTYRDAYNELREHIRAIKARSDKYRQEAEDEKEMDEAEKHARVSCVLNELVRLADAIEVRYVTQSRG